MSECQLGIFEIKLQAVTDIRLPLYKGSTLRGGFGHMFKSLVCVKRDQCRQYCQLKEKCPYGYIFETPIPQDSQIMRKYNYAPHPFVIEPPLDMKQYYPTGDSLSFRLILLGKSIAYIPYFIYTFEELGKTGIGKEKGKYSLDIVFNINQSNQFIPIYTGQDRIVRNIYQPLIISLMGNQNQAELVNQITLYFLTPVRLKYEGHLSRELEFHIFFRNLIRRLGILLYFHCDINLEKELQFRELIEQSKQIQTLHSSLHWFDWERYSAKQDIKMKMGGLIGQITFQGDLTPYLPYLKLGEYLHIGKGTSFGLGQYRMAMESNILDKKI